MATNHTTNYQLNLWEPADAFVRSEFNENSTKIDAALGAHRDALAQLPQMSSALEQHASTLTAHNTAIAERARVTAGTYTGNGASSWTINLGVSAKLLVISAVSAGVPRFTVLIRGQSRGSAADFGNELYGFSVSWGQTQVTLFELTQSGSGLNRSGDAYSYFAIY